LTGRSDCFSLELGIILISGAADALEEGVMKRTSQRYTAAACTFAAALLWATSAQASPVKFTFTGAFNGSFELQDGAPADSFTAGQAFNKSFTNPTGNVGPLGGYVAGYNPAVFSGLDMLINTAANNAFYFDGPKFYSGSEAVPNFPFGSYALRDAFTNASTTLVIGAGAPGAPGPELGGGLLAGLASAFALFATRLRRRPAC
jgi:hypothetical protein